MSLDLPFRYYIDKMPPECSGCVTYKLAEGTVCPVIQVINEDLKQDPVLTPVAHCSHRHLIGICLTDNQPLGLASFQSTSLSAHPLPVLRATLWRSCRGWFQKPYWSPGRKYPLLFPDLPGQVDLLHLRSLSSCSGMTFSCLATHDDFLILNVLRINCCINFPGTEVKLLGLYFPRWFDKRHKTPQSWNRQELGQILKEFLVLSPVLRQICMLFFSSCLGRCFSVNKLAHTHKCAHTPSPYISLCMYVGTGWKALSPPSQDVKDMFPRKISSLLLLTHEA